MIPAYAPYDATGSSKSDSQFDVVAATDASRFGHGLGAMGGHDRSPLQSTSRAGDRGIARQRFSLRSVSHGTVLLTLNQLAVMNQNGIEIAEAIETAASNCGDKRLADTLRQIHLLVNSGQTFSAAVAANSQYFPSTLAPMLAAAETTGEVPQTLGRVCERLRGELRLRGTVVGAMIYPMILVFASSMVMAALVLGVLPQFSKVFLSLGRPIPASTQFLLTVGDFSRAYWFGILAALIGVVTPLIMLRHHRVIQGPLNRFLMYGWLIRDAYRPLQAGRSFRTIASMVAGGVPLLQSVRLTRQTTSDVYWQNLLDRVEENLIDGSTASKAMWGVDFIPAEAFQMMATAERTGRVSEVLDDIGEFYEEEAERRIKRLVVAIEPVIILVMGVVVAGVVMSLLLPMLDVTSVGK